MAATRVRTLSTYAAKEATQSATWLSGITLSADVPSGNHLVLIIGSDVGDGTSPHPDLSFNVGSWSRIGYNMGTSGAAYTFVKGYVYMAPGPFSNGQQIIVTESRTPTTATNARGMVGYEVTGATIPSQKSGQSGNTTGDPVPSGTTNDLVLGAAFSEDNAAPADFTGTGWTSFSPASVASSGGSAATNIGIKAQLTSWSSGMADYNPTTVDGGKIAITITAASQPNGTLTTTTGTSAAAGSTGALTGVRNETLTTTTGSAPAAGGTGALSGTSGGDVTLTTTTGTAPAAGGTGALTGTRSATLTTTTGTAPAAGGTGALTGSTVINATLTTTAGTSAAAGGTGALTATTVVNATLTTTRGSAVAAGGTGTLSAIGPYEPPRRWAAPAPVDTNTLGSGIHSVFLHDRGGQRRIGAIIDNTMVRWERVRDDISSATIIVSPEGVMACSDVLREMSVGRHEIVIYRNKERVWEGPITRITWKSSSIEITAHDICHYLTRTIMRSGYDNRYSAENSKVGPVTERMRTILVNELQRKEALTPPYRILNYLDVRTNENTVNTARLSLPYQRTVWEEMDEMAAKSGLDYTVVGRRLALWDVHDNIGQLPLLSDKDFESELIVTAYGMELCTYSAVTDGEGRWGAVGTSQDPYYGEVELLHTMYGEGLDAEDPENPTQAELDALARELTSQAQRNLAGRYPTPTIVRIPDGTGLNPNAPVTITQLVPGVRVPIRATLLSLTLEQEQKLDRVAVEQTAGGETVSVTLSPAPGSTPWDDSTDSMSEDE